MPLRAAVSSFHHVRVERRRPSHGLARVVDDEVEAVARLQHLAAERLDARRVPQVEPENLQPIAPLAEVGLARVSRRRVPRKARRHDELRARTKQLESGLITDLHAPARQERHAAAKVGELCALGEVQLGARRAHLVVEVMDLRVLLLADVAVLELRRSGLRRRLGIVDVLLLELLGRKDIRRVEDRFSAGACGCLFRPGRFRPASPAALCGRAPRPSPCGAARSDRGCRRAQPPEAVAAVPRRHPLEHRSIATRSPRASSIASRRRSTFPVEDIAPRVLRGGPYANRLLERM